MLLVLGFIVSNAQINFKKKNCLGIRTKESVKFVKKTAVACL